nr:MAG TPA: hypothetical protein [Caudoviricetes sp.]
MRVALIILSQITILIMLSHAKVVYSSQLFISLFFFLSVVLFTI